MKTPYFTLLLALFTILPVSPAVAQSQFTLYGVIDTMVHSSNHEITANGTGTKTTLEQGVFQGPRLGFKAHEEMADGLQAICELEIGFQSNTGQNDQQGQLFGRHAFVGIKDKKWGELDLGRQYGVAFDLLGNYDPLGLGNTSENAWQIALLGVRFDNSLKYTNSWGPVSTEVMYSTGGQAGSTAPGSTYGFALSYKDGPFSIGAFEQQSTDAGSHKANVAGFGTSYVTGPATLYFNYFNALRDGGFSIAAKNSGGPLANTSMLGNINNTLQRKDNVITTGLVYTATPVMSYTLGYMTDFVQNETSLGNSGRISTLYAVADYSLSKRTHLYLSVDYTKVAGGEVDNGVATNTILQNMGAGLGGETNRTGIAVGMRTMF